MTGRILFFFVLTAGLFIATSFFAYASSETINGIFLKNSLSGIVGRELVVKQVDDKINFSAVLHNPMDEEALIPVTLKSGNESFASEEFSIEAKSSKTIDFNLSDLKDGSYSFYLEILKVDIGGEETTLRQSSKRVFLILNKEVAGEGEIVADISIPTDGKVISFFSKIGQLSEYARFTVADWAIIHANKKEVTPENEKSLNDEVIDVVQKLGETEKMVAGEESFFAKAWRGMCFGLAFASSYAGIWYGLLVLLLLSIRSAIRRMA